MFYLNFIKTRSVSGCRISIKHLFNWFWRRFKFLPSISILLFSFLFCLLPSCFPLASLCCLSPFPSPKFDADSLPWTPPWGFYALSAPALLSWLTPCWTKNPVPQSRACSSFASPVFIRQMKNGQCVDQCNNAKVLRNWWQSAISGELSDSSLHTERLLSCWCACFCLMCVPNLLYWSHCS